MSREAATGVLPGTGGVLVEACVDTVSSALAAQSGGAARVELCADLLEGGTTPSAGTIAVARERIQIALFVIIRPRGGDFLYALHEFDTMLKDISLAKQLEADGVVIGALRENGTIDQEGTRRLADAARPLPVTFHRAFDLTRDLVESLETLIQLGVDRVLTSGGAPTALEGADMLSTLVQRAGNRITVLAGGGVNETNAAQLVARTGVREIHVRCADRLTSEMDYRKERIAFGKPHTPDEYSRLETNADRIRKVVSATR